MNKLSRDDKIAFANFHEEYLSRYIGMADTKAGVALTINAGLIGFIVTREELWKLAKAESFWLWMLLLDGLLPLVAGGLLLWVIMPRRSEPAKGLVFWRSVREHPDEATYISSVENLTTEELVRERLSHSWALSGVAKNKYNHLLSGLVATAAAVLFTTIHILAAQLSTPPKSAPSTGVKTSTKTAGPAKPAQAIATSPPAKDASQAVSKTGLSAPTTPAADR